MKRFIKNSVGFLISIILIYIVLFKPHPVAWFSGDADIWKAMFGELRFGVSDLKEAGTMLRPVPALIALIILLASMVLRTIRWQFLIRPIGKTKFRIVFWNNAIGYLFNNVIPFRAGEIIRAILVARFSKLPAGSLVATVVLERIFDVAGLALLFALTLTIYPFPHWLRIGGGFLSMVVGIIILTGWMLARSRHTTANWITRKTRNKSNIIKKLAMTLNSILQGLGVLNNRGLMVHVVWSTILLWGMYAIIMKFAFDAFSFTDGRYPLLYGSGIVEAGVVTVVTSFGMGLPSAPGAFGTYHGSVLLSLAWFRVPESIAVIFAAAMHAFNFITMSLLGLIGIARLGVSWQWVMTQAKTSSKEINSNYVQDDDLGDDRI